MLPLYAAGKAARGPYDWLHGDKSARPQFAEQNAIAFHSEAWEAFKAGNTTLSGDNQAGMLLKQGDLAQAFKEQRWRDLAMGVSDSNYQWDLGYFYLAQAAAALGYPQAQRTYAERAAELAAYEDTACAYKRFLSCSGVDVASQVKAPAR
jgi:hypothetical protein